MIKFISTISLFVFFLSFNNAQTPILELVEYATGFTKPVDIQHAGGNELYVVEQQGIIKIIDGDANVLSTPFLDITDRVNDGANERGLLGIAFHPDFTNNGFFYVNYTDNSGADTKISRFSIGASSLIADPDSEFVIMEFDQPANNHNGGGIKFGPDGYLYIGTGDGGSGGDPWGAIGNGQNTETLLAKMLRIDVDGGSPYSIPTDNPFVNNSNFLDEIWAWGLRNPWRFSFDKETGDLWIGDVGQGEWEEIDFQLASSAGGENYGWKCKEGFETFSGNCGGAANFTDPVHAYESTTSVGRSVTGGFVYRGSEFPVLYGHYIYGDYVSGRIWSITPDGIGGWENIELLDFTNNQISSFGEDPNGELYMCAHGQGRIYKLTEQCGNFSFEAESSPTCFGQETGSISIEAIGGDGDYSIAWFLGSDELELTDLAAGIYEGLLTDGNGCEQMISVEIAEMNEVEIEVDYQQSTGIFTVQDVFVSYQWYDENGEPFPGATSSVFDISGTNSGCWAVEVTDFNNCTYISDCLAIVSIGKIEGVDNFQISPNPFSNNVILNFQTDKKMSLNIEITNVEGKVLLTEKTNVNGRFSKKMNLENLVNGVYFLKMKSGQGSIVQKIIKK